MKRSFFLFLGDSDREGVTAKLKTSRVTYKRKMLDSSLDNWKAIFKYLDREDISGVLLKLPRYTWARLISDEYIDSTRALFKKISRLPHVAFTHETFFMNAEPVEAVEAWQYSFQESLSADSMSLVMSLVEEYDLNLLPYKTNAELTVLSLEFVDQADRNLIFRIYVPSDRMWASETEKVIDLFRDYLIRISGLSVRQEQYATAQGIVHEFFGEDAVEKNDLSDQFERFSRFLDLCAVDTQSAIQLIKSDKLSDKTVEDIVDRYAKESRRLQIDLKHEREKRVLSIRHRLESELVDVVALNADWSAINASVDSQVPQLGGVSSAMGFGDQHFVRIQNNLTFNIKPQIIEAVHGVVANEIYGNQNFGIEADRLIEIIQVYGGTRTAELVSSVYELEDTEAKVEKRLSARQKIQAFLIKVAAKLPDAAIGVLQAYVEKKLGL